MKVANFSKSEKSYCGDLTALACIVNNAQVGLVIADILWPKYLLGANMSKSSAIYLGLSVAFLFGGILAAVEAMQDTRSLPSLTVTSAVHDFGRVRQRETLEATFHLRNYSAEMVRIMGTPTDCGCTVAKMASPVIRAGGGRTACLL